MMHEERLQWLARLRRLAFADPSPWLKAALVAAALLSVVLLGFARVATEARFALSLLLLVPTALVGWYLGMRWGAALAAVSVGAWVWADHQSGAVAPGALLANAAIRALVFGLTAFAFAALRQTHRALSELAYFDPLTGLGNRRLLATVLERERRRAARHGQPLSLLYLDLDDFKPVNDRLGHHAGDRALVEVAAALERAVRSSDFVARVGGDEFALMLPGCGAAQVRTVVAKLRADWSRLAAAREQGVGASIGAVTFERVPEAREAMLAEADALMYRAKERGKGGTAYKVVAS